MYFLADTESGKQPSVSLSQECSSLASSNIEPSGREDSGSMIPGPRSCAVSIASSIENLNISIAEHPPNPSPNGMASEPADHELTSTTSSDSSLKKTVQLKVASEEANTDLEQPAVVVAES